MTTRSPFYRLALEANEGQVNVRDDVLPVPTLDERVSLYLRAVHGDREFTDRERSNARDVLLNSMAAQIAAEGIPAEQMEFAARETTHGAGRGASAEGEPQVTGPLLSYYEAARRNAAISVAPIARHRTSMLALTVTFGLVLIVGSGTLGYRWTYPHMEDEVTAPPAEQTRVPPPTTSPRSLSTQPAPKAAPEQHLVQIASQRTEADVLAVFRRLQEEQPTLFGQANLKRIDLGLQSYTAQVGPFASEKDAAALCLALKAADIQCLGQ
jgi:sporulation related protein